MRRWLLTGLVAALACEGSGVGQLDATTTTTTTTTTATTTAGTGTGTGTTTLGAKDDTSSSGSTLGSASTHGPTSNPSTSTGEIGLTTTGPGRAPDIGCEDTTLLGGEGTPMSLAVRPDGRAVVSGTRDDEGWLVGVDTVGEPRSWATRFVPADFGVFPEAKGLPTAVPKIVVREEAQVIGFVHTGDQALPSMFGFDAEAQEMSWFRPYQESNETDLHNEKLDYHGFTNLTTAQNDRLFAMMRVSDPATKDPAFPIVAGLDPDSGDLFWLRTLAHPLGNRALALVADADSWRVIGATGGAGPGTNATSTIFRANLQSGAMEFSVGFGNIDGDYNLEGIVVRTDGTVVTATSVHPYEGEGAVILQHHTFEFEQLALSRVDGGSGHSVEAMKLGADDVVFALDRYDTTETRILRLNADDTVEVVATPPEMQLVDIGIAPGGGLLLLGYEAELPILTRCDVEVG